MLLEIRRHEDAVSLVQEFHHFISAGLHSDPTQLDKYALFICTPNFLAKCVNYILTQGFQTNTFVQIKTSILEMAIKTIKMEPAPDPAIKTIKMEPALDPRFSF